MPLVSVIVVNWNRLALTRQCIASLDAQTFRDFEIIVVDNGSQDGSWQWFLEHRPDINLICLPKNEGFAGGNNHGIRAARGKYVALLNNDALADPDWLMELRLSAMISNYGMFASKILRPDGSIESMGCTVYPDGNGMCRRDAGNDENLIPSGCAAMYRKSVLDRIGLFDERFWMYNEDTELGIRAHKAGYGCLYVPTAVVMHFGSISSSRNSLKKLYYVERNRILIMLKYFTVMQIVKSVPWTVLRYLKGGR